MCVVDLVDDVDLVDLVDLVDSLVVRREDRGIVAHLDARKHPEGASYDD